MKSCSPSYRSWSSLLAVGVMVLIPACGGNDHRKTYPVTGKVLIDNAPAAEGVMLELHPQFTETDRMPIHPRAATTADGQFKFNTYVAEDGVPEGEYVLTVTWPQRVGMSPHFSGDLFSGAFGKADANKGKPEFTVKVTKEGAKVDLTLTLTPDQKKALEAGRAKVQKQNATMFGGGN